MQRYSVTRVTKVTTRKRESVAASTECGRHGRHYRREDFPGTPGGRCFGKRLILYKIGAFTFRTGIRDLHRDAPGEAFNMSTNEASPTQGFHFLELRDEAKSVIGSFPDEVKGRPETF